MAEKESPTQPKDLVEATPEEEKKLEEEEKKEVTRVLRQKDRRETQEEKRERELQSWIPKTELGRAVKTGKEKSFDKILKTGKKILEPEIVDTLLKIETDLALIGQAKGKFGGGKRRAWRQTQKKTQEGNILTFSSTAIVGDKNGHIGVGYGRAKETLPAREKALRQAKLNVIKVIRGFESPETEEKGNEPHTLPFTVEGKCGSVRMKLIPAPRGTGLVTGDECKKILTLAGIKDVYSKTKGQTKTTFNVAKACVDALAKTSNPVLGLESPESTTIKKEKTK